MICIELALKFPNIVVLCYYVGDKFAYPSLWIWKKLEHVAICNYIGGRRGQ